MKDRLRKVIFNVCILVFIASACILIKLLLVDPYIASKVQSEAQQIYYNSSSKTEENGDEKTPNFSQLIALNEDIKAWIKIENTNIDYPVTQSDNNSFYLQHNYKKEPSKYGSIFIDSNCGDLKTAKNILLHGHHMKDGQMFAGLMKFSDLDFYKSTPTIAFDTPDKAGNWKIISVFKTNTLPTQGEVFDYLAISFPSDASFLNYVYQVRLRSLIDIPVDVNENDTLLTLSTCSYEFDDFRTVIVARRVRVGERKTVDTQNAKRSAAPLMPECWYKRYGGFPPKYSNFTEDYQNGKITWYG